MRETQAFLTGEQRDWKVPPEPSEVKRLAGSYSNAALGEIVVREGKDEVVFQFGGAAGGLSIPIAESAS